MIVSLILASSLVFFDDFSYRSVDDLPKNRWIIRTKKGWPGVVEATWGKERLSVKDGVLRMTSWTDGTPANTKQAQICHERKYREGTYAARVRFSDTPSFGPDVDSVVQTFYAISPQKAPMDPDYSEIDFEYLPNGGWGKQGPFMDSTTWETFQLEPWKADNASERVQQSFGGWHTLVFQVANHKTTYFIDGRQVAEHGEKYYPEVPMSINFNLWYVKSGLSQDTAPRSWIEDIDWVFHRAGVVLSHEQVEVEVANMRRRKVAFRDTVPRPNPPLTSPCDF